MFMKKALVLSFFVALTVLAWSQDTMKKDPAPSTDGSMMKAAPAMMDSSAYDLAGLGNQVVAFTTEKAAMTLAKNQTVVYFFAATWCPTCQETYKDLKAHFSKLPLGTTLVFVNYDKATDLKKKYGVTSQHTFVLIGQGGEKRKIWTGSTTVDDLVKNTKMM